MDPEVQRFTTTRNFPHSYMTEVRSAWHSAGRGIVHPDMWFDENIHGVADLNCGESYMTEMKERQDYKFVSKYHANVRAYRFDASLCPDNNILKQAGDDVINLVAEYLFGGDEIDSRGGYSELIFYAKTFRRTSARLHQLFGWSKIATIMRLESFEALQTERQREQLLYVRKSDAFSTDSNYQVMPDDVRDIKAKKIGRVMAFQRWKLFHISLVLHDFSIPKLERRREMRMRMTETRKRLNTSYSW